MRKNLLLFAFLLLSVCSGAQCPFNCPCVDSSRINIYYQCYDDYQPVCGCDGHTYRSLCAAYNWGGLINAPIQPTNGPCGDFDFEFTPNPVVPGSSLNGVGKLSIYSKVGPVNVLIQFYDIFGRGWYAPELSAGGVTIQESSGNGIYTTDVHMDAFPQGIYYLFVTIEGEALHKKILKMNYR